MKNYFMHSSGNGDFNSNSNTDTDRTDNVTADVEARQEMFR